MTDKKTPYYAQPEQNLQQGDVFRIDLVAPAADEVQRIFRSKDGRHGSVVFAENCDAKVFSRTELDTLLATATSPRSDLHIKPFEKTPDGQLEMVVVYSRLFRYFIIATQTCDISGMDKPPYEWATITPVITISELCHTDRLPFQGTTEVASIHEFVRKYCPDSSHIETLPDIQYPDAIRKIVGESINSTTVSKKLKIDFRHIKNFLSQYHNKGYVYPLLVDASFGLPESYADFTAIFTVPTNKISTLQKFRILTLTQPYRDEFGHKFGEFFSRVAVPTQMKPPK